MTLQESTPEEEALAKAAQGAAVALLVAFFGGLGLAFLTHRLHGGPYIPVVLPGLCGAAIGGLIALARIRLGSFDPRVGLAASALAGIVYILGLQLFIYLRSMDAPETRELLQLAARGDGWWDFIVWTSTDRTGAELSPLGVVGRTLPGPIVTTLVIAAELVVTVATAVRFERRKVAAAIESTQSSPGTRRQRLVHGMPGDALLASLRALEEGRVEHAAQLFAQHPGGGSHAVYITTASHGAADSLIEVVEEGDDGTTEVRARRSISSWEGQTLVDELRLARTP